MTVAVPQPVARPRSAWIVHVAIVSALALLWLFCFRDAVAAAVNVWIVSPTYSHCFLILPISAWLVWEARASLSAVVPKAFPLVLLLLPPLLGLWWVGEVLSINEVRQFAAVAVLQAVIFAVLGKDVMRIVWFPVFYLLFLVPTGEYLITPMQRFAADFVGHGLTLLNIPFYREGTLFELTNGRFEIAEACAGLRFLIATVTLSVLFASMMFRKVYKWVLFLAASIVVPLVGNGLRCVGIILLAHFTNNAYGAGADHIVYGWGFNVAILMLMIFLGFLFRDHGEDAAPKRTLAPDKRDESGLALVAVCAAVLLAAVPAIAAARESQAQAIPSLMTDAQSLAPWRDSTAEWRPSFADADATRGLAMTAGGLPVDLFLAYYARSRPGHVVTSHVHTLWNDHWSLLSSRAVDTRIGLQPATMQEWLLNTPAGPRLVWAAYRIDRRFTTSMASIKLLQLRAAFQGADDQEVVALSVPVLGTVEDARVSLDLAAHSLSFLAGGLDGSGRGNR